MRLGTRWAVGTTPPAAVPAELRGHIESAEQAFRAHMGRGEDDPGAAWTLTWLEGRPIATLDDGTTVTVDGTVEGSAHDSVDGAPDTTSDTDDW